MATVGQIVYNVQDYQTSGGYISTSTTNLNTTISSANNPGYDDAKIDIFDSNIVDRFGSKQFTKLGVNAPPGTRFILNTNKTILVGRSGIYELDEDIIITSLQFVRPKRYIKDDAATESALNNGIAGFRDAENQRIASLADLDRRKPSMTDEAYWTEYSEIQAEYNKAYQIALAQFNMGLNGIYKLPNTSDPDSEENFQDLYNIIIDFLY